MAKIIKIVLSILGITIIGGVIVKERESLNDLRKRLFDMRYFEAKKPDECKK